MSFMLKNRPATAKKQVPKTVQVKDTSAITTTRPTLTPRSLSAIRDTPRSHSYIRNVTRTPESSIEPSPRRRTTKKREMEVRLQSDSEEDNDSAASTPFEIVRPNKRRKNTIDSSKIDKTRDLRAISKFTSVDQSKLIHAADIANLDILKQKYKPVFGATADQIDVELQYPNGSRREKYKLVWASNEFDPIEEIIDVVKDFANFFLTPEQAVYIQSPNDGINRRLARAKGVKDIGLFKDALLKYNEELERLRLNGTIEKNLANKHMLSLDIVKRITKQIYDRAISPDIRLLRSKSKDVIKDFTYGELGTSFAYQILSDCGINSSQVFVDLGSGVANIVVQAALQTGCESWGCEIVEKLFPLARAQKRECEARCRLWGIKPGSIHLEEGDFLENTSIKNALQRADVVLINNEVFDTATNQKLIALFLDLKDGCQIISLKRFGRENQSLSEYNENDLTRNLHVEKKEYSPGSVSWKYDGGTYFVATKLSHAEYEASRGEQ